MRSRRAHGQEPSSHRCSERLSDVATMTKLTACRSRVGSHIAALVLIVSVLGQLFLSNDRFSDTWSFGWVILELQRISLLLLFLLLLRLLSNIRGTPQNVSGLSLSRFPTGPGSCCLN